MKTAGRGLRAGRSRRLVEQHEGKPNMAAARGFGYLPQLDGLRAVAVIAVMADHAQVPFVRGGGIGVDVFFVLSGYLITTLLLQEFDATGTISMRNFYTRRARRLLPALVAVAVFALVAFPIVRPDKTDATILGAVTALLYVSCWFRAFSVSDLGWFGHSWSLSVEEHFYVLWPPALRSILRRGIHRLRQWVFGILAVAVAYRVLSALAGIGGARTNGPDMRAGQLLTGCALAVLLMGGWSERRRWDRWWTILVVLSIVDLARIVVAPYAFGADYLRIVGIETVALESAIVISYVVVRSTSILTKLLSHRSMVWLGRRSYAIYLWHLPLLGLLSFKGQATSVRMAGRAAAIALTLVAAWASFKWVESPFYRRRVEEEETTDQGAPPPEEDEAMAAGPPGGRSDGSMLEPPAPRPVPPAQR